MKDVKKREDDLPGRREGDWEVNPKRQQSRGEEIANSVSHGLGVVAALLATPLLLVRAGESGNVGFIIGAAIFALTMILLYLGSTLYHALPAGRVKRIFRVIEHSAIFFLIAGTYTPFTLGVLRGLWGWSLLAIIWTLAVAGVVMKIVSQKPHPVFSTALYLLMGWLIVIAIKPLLERGVPIAGILLLLAGGLSYTSGVAFYAADSRLRYGHFVWHLFVMAGTACHYLAVYWYAA